MTTQTNDAATGSGKYELLIERTKGIPAIPTAMAYPCDEVSLGAAVEGAQMGIITPLLVGPEQKIRTVAAEIRPRPLAVRAHRCPRRPRGGGQGGGAGAPGARRAPDEGEPPHR